jgi:hypothetical protein
MIRANAIEVLRSLLKYTSMHLLDVSPVAQTTPLAIAQHLSSHQDVIHSIYTHASDMLNI